MTTRARKTKQPAPPVLPRLHRLFQKTWKMHYSIALKVQDLIEGRQADVNARDEAGNTPLHACLHGHADAVPVLIKYRAEVDAKNNDGKTALQLACTLGLTDAVKALLKAGAEMEARDNYGDMPLHHACGHGRPHAVQFLLEHGADVNARDKGDRIPLDLTARLTVGAYAKKKIIELFREHAPELVMEAYCNSNKEVTHAR